MIFDDFQSDVRLVQTICAPLPPECSGGIALDIFTDILWSRSTLNRKHLAEKKQRTKNKKPQNNSLAKQKQKKKMKMLQMFAGCLAADRASSSLSYLFSLRQKRFLSPCSRGRCDAFAGQAVAQEKKAFKGGTVFPAQRASSCVARRLRTSRGDKIWLIDGPLHPYCASIRATGAGRKRRRRSNSRD